MANKARVSLCMIVRDEEENLEACLSPVVDLVDEIVIVDTGSCDATKSIAGRFTTKVYDFPWCDDFAAARNETLRHATGDWIFWLDADDRIRPEQVPALRQTLSGLDDQSRVMMMNVLLPAATAQEEAQVVSHSRLFRRHPDVRWQGRIHEQLSPCFESLGFERVFTDVQIEHLGYTNVVQAQRKLRSKLRLLRMEYAVDPDNPCTLLHLATALCGLKRLDEAQSHVKRLFVLAAGDPNYLRWAYETQIRILLAIGKGEEALRYAKRGTALFPGSQQLLYLRAMAELLLDDREAGARTLEELISSPPVEEITFGSFANLKTKLAPRLLAVIRRTQGAYAECEAILHRILQDHPAEGLIWYELGLVCVDRCDPQRLKSVAQQLVLLPSGDSFAALVVALWHLRYGDLAAAGQLIDHLLMTGAQPVRTRMLRAEWLNKTNASIDTQIDALRDILRMTPNDKETLHFLQMATQIKESAPFAPVIAPVLTGAAVAAA